MHSPRGLWWEMPEEEVEYETHNAPRGQNTPPPGTRPGVLKEPGAQEATVTVGYVAAAGAPLLAQLALDAPVPLMVDTVLEFFRALDKPDDELVIAVPQISTDRVSQRLVERRLPQMVEKLVEVPTVVSYFSLLQRKAKKDEEEEMEKRVAKHTAVQSEAAETMQRARLLLEQASKRRKRKKRRKRRTPRTSFRSSCGPSRRRQRQWRVRHAGFAGSCAPRAVFPVAYDWPSLLGNTAGMDQKDNFFVVVMALAYAKLVLLVSLVPLCSFLSWSGPDAPHHGQYPPEGLLFSGLVLLVILHLTLFPSCCQALDACRQSRRQVCIMAGMDQKDRYVVPCRKLWKIRSWSSSTRSSSFLSICRGGSLGLTVHADH